MILRRLLILSNSQVFVKKHHDMLNAHLEQMTRSTELVRKNWIKYSAIIINVSTQLMRKKITIQALTNWIIELLKKTSTKKEIESNLSNSFSKKKKKKIIVKTKKAKIVDLKIIDLITLSIDSSQSITKSVIDVKEKDDLKNDANDENIESAITKKKSMLSATIKLVAKTKSSTQSFIVFTWTSINQFAQIIVLSSFDQNRTLNFIKTSILAIFKLLSSHSCKCQKCDSTTHDEYVARTKMKLRTKEYQTLNARMKKDYIAKNRARLKMKTRAIIKNVMMRKIKANVLKEVMSTISKQLSMTIDTFFQ